jgi:hypothetical protein
LFSSDTKVYLGRRYAQEVSNRLRGIESSGVWGGMVCSVSAFDVYGEPKHFSVTEPTCFPFLSGRGWEAIDKGRRELIPELSHNFGKISSDSPMLKGEPVIIPLWKRGI